MNPPAKPICFPPAAVNGGPLETALPKVGEWVYQPKVDDWRAVVHRPTMTVWNQYGERMSIEHKFKAALIGLRQAWVHEPMLEWLDCGMMENRNDLMRGCIIVFDCIFPDVPYSERRGHVANLAELLPFDVAEYLKEMGGKAHDRIFLVPQVVEVAGLSYWRELQRQNAEIGHKFYEGVVGKRVNSHYTFGRKPKQVTPNWIKHRFDQ